MTMKKGDTVYVIAGRDKGKQGTVEKFFPAAHRVIVNGVNIRKHHIKPSKTQPKGGIAEFPAAFSSANVMVLCPICSKTTRIKQSIGADGNKFRMCSRCQGSLDSK
jgi:large subunit ribosomal protein L24